MAVPIILNDPQESGLVKTHLSHLYDGMIGVGKQGKAPGELWCPAGVAIEPFTNRIFIAEGSFYVPRVSIFTQTGELVNTFTHEQMRHVWGIAVYRENVHLTDKVQSCILHFKLGKEVSFEGRIGGRGSGMGQFKDPRQITVASNGELFIADRDNNRVQVLDNNLKYDREISHQSMAHPSDVKLKTGEVYVLSDTDSYCVHVFSYLGAKLRSVVTRGVGMAITRAYFFYVDANKNLVISDCFAHQVKIFSGDGALLHTIGEQGHEGGKFYRPVGVALNDNFDLVVVSENISHELQIFSPLIDQ